MNLDSVYVSEKGIVAREIAGETILVPMTRRAQEMGLFTLNPVGTFIWERLDGARALGPLRDEITSAFDVDAETAWADLAAFLEQLACAGCAREQDPEVAP